jgi:hypothetical protein
VTVVVWWYPLSMVRLLVARPFLPCLLGASLFSCQQTQPTVYMVWWYHHTSKYSLPISTINFEILKFVTETTDRLSETRGRSVHGPHRKLKKMKPHHNHNTSTPTTTTHDFLCYIHTQRRCCLSYLLPTTQTSP